MSWMLIVMLGYGFLAIPGYPTKESCEAAGPIVAQATFGEFKKCIQAGPPLKNG